MKNRYFKYYIFNTVFLAIYCDEDDRMIGHFTLTNGNEFGQLYVSPNQRGTEVVHVLIREALDIVHSWGFPCIWGVCFERMKKFYDLFRRKYHLHLEFPETPETRDDGQYKVVLYFEEGKND